MLLFGILVLFIGLCVRILAAYMASMGAGISGKERLFIAFAWMPKATVQVKYVLFELWIWTKVSRQRGVYRCWVYVCFEFLC